MNPTTGRAEPKHSYLIEIDWDGERAPTGAGVYGKDRPCTCNADGVNDARVTDTPSDRMLQEFVRCVAMLLESTSYFTMNEFERHSQWTDGPTYVYVMDMMGNQLMSSSRNRLNGHLLHRWGGRRHATSFEGRDIVAIGDSFGESLI